MEIEHLAEGLVRLSRGGVDYLGIVTYVPSQSFAVTRLTRTARTEGYLVEEGAVTPWKPAGFVEHAGRVLLYGPYVEGKTLAEIERDRPEDILPFLSRLAGALEVIETQGLRQPVVHTRGIIFLESGGVLFLPPEIMNAIHSHQTEDDRKDFFDHFNHPDLSGRAALGFSLAAILYRALTGNYPFPGASEEEIRDLMRHKLSRQPIAQVPEIRPEVNDFLVTVLNSPESADISMAAWHEELQQWIMKGTHRELSEPQREEILARARTAHNAMERVFRRQEYLRKNWKKITAIALISILAGAVPITMLVRALQPRVTAGMKPAQVVSMFYQSMNNLDHATMQDCVTGNAGKQQIREVTNLFIMDRMRLAMEFRSGFMSAQRWVEAGKPEVTNDTIVYGVTDLKVEAQRDSGDARVFLVNYNKWIPQFTSEGPPGPEPQGTHYSERLFLTQKRHAWVITRIERISERALPPVHASAPG